MPSEGTMKMLESFSVMRCSSVADVEMHSIAPDTELKRKKRTKEHTEQFAKVFTSMIEDTQNIFGRGLECGDVKILAALSQPVFLQQGDIFCSEAERAEHLAVIIEGSVSVITLRRVFSTLGPGRVLGEIGLVKGTHLRSATIRADTDCMLATLPYSKFLRYLKSLGEHKESALLSFCVNELVPRFHALDYFKIKHRSAILIQSNFRSHSAKQAFRHVRNMVLMKSVLKIQRLFKRFKARFQQKKEIQAAFAQTLQIVWRSHKARKEYQRVMQLRRQGYGIRQEKAARVIQERFRIWAARRQYIQLNKRGSSLLDMEKLEARRISLAFGNIASQETTALFQKWQRVVFVRSFNTWKALVSATARQIVRARLAARSLVYGALFSCLHRWREQCKNITVVAPWRGRKGKLVELSDEGKEFEYARGKRIEGDSGCGELVQKVVADGSVWQVRWRASGQCGSYYTGSCGRFHLLWWREQREEQDDEVAKKAQWIGSFHKAMASLHAALRRDKGIRAVGSITPALGGTVQLPCPLGSTWLITATFPPRAVLQSCQVQLSAIESADFDASRSHRGYLCSPMVSVLPRDGVFVLDNPLTLRIPHRCSATAHLALYIWHDDCGGSDKVPGAVFTDTYCTVTVDRFGLYGVVNSAIAVPDVVYGALEVPNLRDSSGRYLSKVSLGTPFKARVILVPRAYANASHRVWALLPTFHLRNGMMLEKVAVHSEQRLEGCSFNSWSARHTYTGRLITLFFHTIIQIAPGQTADQSQSFPVTNLHVTLFDDEQVPVVRFRGQPEFLVKIVTLQVAVGIDMPDGSAYSTFVCTLHGRETMASVRRWVAKCWFLSTATLDDLDWFCR